MGSFITGRAFISVRARPRDRIGISRAVSVGTYQSIDCGIIVSSWPHCLEMVAKCPFRTFEEERVERIPELHGAGGAAAR